MNKYQIRFWDDGFLKKENNDYKTIKGKSVKDLAKHLWKYEKDHIYRIMKTNNELTLWQHDKTLLLVNQFDENEWYDLDTGEQISIKDLQKLKKNRQSYQKIKIDQLKSTQFYHLIILMWKELCDDHGGAYLEFYQKTDGEWVDMLD